MEKRLLNVLKISGFKYFRVIMTCEGEIENEELITLKGLKSRIKKYSKDFECGLININDIDDFSVMFLASFTIEDLRDFSNTKNVFVEGVVVETN